MHITHARSSRLTPNGMWKTRSGTSKKLSNFSQVMRQPRIGMARCSVGNLFNASRKRRHLDRARELDPLSPWNDINSIAWWLYQGQASKAFDVGEHAIQLGQKPWV